MMSFKVALLYLTCSGSDTTGQLLCDMDVWCVAHEVDSSEIKAVKC